MKDIFEELKTLTAIPALSGHEDRMIGQIIERLKPLADDIEIDRIGNLTATFYGRSDDVASMLVFAHIDEVGMIVRKIEEDGFLRFERVGGIPEKTLRGQYVDVYSIDGTSYVTGVVGTVAHHLTTPEEKTSVPSRLDMYIDIGLTSREEVLAKGINIGSPITYHPNFNKIGENRIASKSLDNRIGVYLLLRLAEHLHLNQPSVTVFLVFSVQEEFNVRGLLPVFERLKPHAAICLDITPACDTPDLKMIYDVALSKGPAITYMNFHGRGTLGGLLPNPKLRRFIELTAEDLKIPYQREVIVGVITDDAFSQFAGTEGTAMAHLSIPIRYSHSPIEIADIRDIEAGATLLNEVIRRFNGNLDLQRGI
jgi:putative aminopeptidase FrvX